MKISKYIKKRGLTVRLVAQTMGITRQAIEQYGDEFQPTTTTLLKIANAMSELGAETRVVDLVAAMYSEK